mgnify:CR=1 FL=1
MSIAIHGGNGFSNDRYHSDSNHLDNSILPKVKKISRYYLFVGKRTIGLKNKKRSLLLWQYPN